jgi:hypothetical protein
VEGTTVITYDATDSSQTVETVVTNSGLNVSTATPSLTIKVDLTPPTVSCTAPAPAWQATDVMVPCTAADNAGGSGLVGPSSFTLQTNVPTGTETNSVTIPAVTVKDVAGNTSAPQGPFGPFEVDKKAPVITGPTISPSSPVFGQSVTANYSCTDGGSGAVQCGPSGSASFPATASTGPLSSPADSTTGTHTFTVLAKDAVGNQSVPSPVTYTVSQATPVITWAAPAPITYGTPLSAAQLNATANVAGTFVYTPPAGTILQAGSQTLSVMFTPTDAVDYRAASAQVTLLVQSGTQISISPTSINFGTLVRVSGVVSQVVTVTNIGNANVTFSKVAIPVATGTDQYDYWITNKCRSTLPPGANCLITVFFEPDDVGVKSATLVFIDNAAGSPQSVSVTATVVK